jgi:ATP-dependent helicase/nuclease subunit A
MSSPTSELASRSVSQVEWVYPNLFIRAGAGAGKTTRLISTFIDFVQKFKAHHQRYPKVVLTTFTRKSTQEIKERLLVKALDLNDQDLFAYMNKKSFVHISTIHGVLGLFLNQYQDDVGLSTDFKVLDKEQIRKQSFKELKSIFKSNTDFMELLEHYTFQNLLDHLDKTFEFANQHSQIYFVSSDVLIQRREKEFDRIISLIETLTELPTPSGKGWLEYFQQLGQIRQALVQKNLDLALQISDQLPSKPRFSADKPAFDTDLHEELQKYISSSKAILNQLDTDEYIVENHRMNELFHRLQSIFSEKIKASRQQKNEITISDLETLSLQILKKSPEKARQFSEGFDYFMIDEFQDTSPLQLQILNQFIGDRPHFVVGDPQQSIYLFRGARSEVFLSKQAEALKGNYENIRLNTNYRSRPSLMKFMNHFFTDFSTAFEPMDHKPIEVESDSAFLDAYYIQSKNETLATLVHIQKLIQSGAQASDICVLSKKNASLMSLAQEAGKFNVPVQLMVAAGFDDRREILDLVSFVRFLVNPYDTENLIQLLRSPWFLMTDSDLVGFRQNKSEPHLWMNLKLSNHPDVFVLQKYLEQMNDQGILQTTKDFIQNSKMLESCEYLDATGKKEANIWKFVQNLRDQMNHKSFHLNEYLTNQFSSLQSDLGSNLSEAQPVISPERVSLMTIHNAKGLQFPHVIVIGMKDQPNVTTIMPLAKDEDHGLYNLGIFSAEDSQIKNSYWSQTIRQQFNQREHAESERLLYVAMTRAMTSIAMIAEDKKKNLSTTWFAKSKWPDVGQHLTDEFKVESLRDDSEPVVLILQKKSKSEIQKPYRILTEATAGSESVTEKIAKSKFSKLSEVSNQFVQNLMKAKTGTDLHKLFESLKYNSLEDVKAWTTEKNRKYLDFLIHQTQIPLSEILQQGHVEWGFGLQIKTSEQNKMIQGQIDAWGILGKTVYVLDYKTGTSEYVESAYEQLRFYASCLKAMKFITADHQVILGVLYPVEEKVFVKTVSYSDLSLE